MERIGRDQFEILRSWVWFRIWKWFFRPHTVRFDVYWTFITWSSQSEWRRIGIKSHVLTVFHFKIKLFVYFRIIKYRLWYFQGACQQFQLASTLLRNFRRFFNYIFGYVIEKVLFSGRKCLQKLYYSHKNSLFSIIFVSLGNFYLDQCEISCYFSALSDIARLLSIYSVQRF